ncbi:hypothetical protein ACFIQF_13225 [Comamonas sp. J-3]
MTRKEVIAALVKSFKPLPGQLQCVKCGGRTVMVTTTGASIDDKGRYHRGTVCDDRVCYHCHMQGIWSPMIPDKPRALKEPKPKRRKPKPVK